MKDFVTFQEFDTKEAAEALAAILRKNNIQAEIQVNRNLLDQNIIGTQYNNFVQLKLRGADFNRARQALIENTPVDLADVPEDYMLQAFTDNELIKVLANPDEWGAYNYNVAAAILKTRGVKMEEAEISKMQQQHLAELSRRRSLTHYNLLLGYGISAFSIIGTFLNSGAVVLPWLLFYSVPGFLGVVFGLIYRLTKKTLPDGTQIYSYDDGARRHGLLMIGLNLLAIAYAAVSKIL